MAWTRDTSWRQGHLLADDAIEGTGIRGAVAEGSECALVISHDCDLAADVDKEPDVELLVANFIPAVDGNFTRAKNPRKLHVEAEGENGVERLELTAQRRLTIAKELLSPYNPRPVYLTPQSKNALQAWLAARYRRSAFPNAFETRLDAARLKAGIVKAMQKSANLFVALLADVDQGSDVERLADHDTYELGLIIVYDGDVEGARQAAEDAAQTIETLFEEKLLVEGTWRSIRLSYCEAVSDEVLTVAQAEFLRPFYLDYMSIEDQ